MSVNGQQLAKSLIRASMLVDFGNPFRVLFFALGQKIIQLNGGLLFDGRGHLCIDEGSADVFVSENISDVLKRHPRLAQEDA